MFLNRKSHKKTEEHKSGFQNPKILDVNLIKDERRVTVNRQKNFLSLFFVILLLALFVTEIYFGLSSWELAEEKRAEVISSETAKAGQEIVKLQNQNKDALNYKAKSATFTELLNNHIYWSNFFGWLEKNTLSTVSFSSFNGTLSGKYNIEGRASSYSDVSWQVKALLNDKLTESVSVAKVTAGKNKEENNGVDFVLSLKIKPEIFKK